MRKQTIAIVASGLLLASGLSFAQEEANNEAAAGTAATTETGGEGVLGNYGGVALGGAILGLAVAAASGSGGSSGTTGTIE
ncbi:MAG: hypothetical protein WC953_06255 [Pseudomonas sp.]